MRELNIGRLLELHEIIVIRKGEFERVHIEAVRRGDRPKIQYDLRVFLNLEAAVSEIEEIARSAQLTSTQQAAIRTKEALAKVGAVNATVGTMLVDEEGAGAGFRHLMDIASRVRDDCAARLYFQIDHNGAQLLRQATPLFGDQVHNNFQSAQYDIEEAGKCMALGRWTAAVLHLMRCLEPALAALESKVEVATSKENWGNKIEQIEAALHRINKRDHSVSATKDELRWYAECATHFRYMKDAWRNYAAHGRDKYDEERSRRIYDNVRGFMIHLAEKLKE